MGKADLHIHTTASDGSSTPDEIVRLARSKLLNTIAITDHDTLEGYRQAVPVAEELSVRLIPGVELSARGEGRSVHVLAYQFDPENLELNELLRRQRSARIGRMERILDHLRSKEGIDFTLDEVRAQARSGNVGRPHVARLMVRKKVVSSVPEAFIRYLGSGKISGIGTLYAELEEVIDVVARAGGMTSLAHPGPLYPPAEVERLISVGLDGLECIHPSHGFDQQKRFTELAEQKHLLITGGSDFHGTGKEYAPWFGVLTLSEKRVAALDRAARNRQQLNGGADE